MSIPFARPFAISLALCCAWAGQWATAEPPPRELPETDERPAVVAIIEQFHVVEKIEQERQTGALVIHLRGRGDQEKASTRLTLDAMIRDHFKGAARLLPEWVPQKLLDHYFVMAGQGETTNRYEDEPEKVAHLTALLQACVESVSEPVNLMETIASGGSPKPSERALVVAFADRVNHVEAIYDARGSVTHLEISNHAMWIERHRLGEARPGLTDAEFRRIAELPSLESLQILQQPLSDDAYAVLAHFPGLKAFRIEGHRTDEAGGGSHRFMLHINHCLNLEALELKHLFGLRGTSVAKLGPMPKLEYLELDNDSAGPEALAFLEGCPNLRDFELHRTSMNDEQIGRVVDLLPKLKRFVIKPGSPRLTASSLRHLQRLNELKVVGLHQWKRPGSLPWDDGLKHLLSVPTLEMVEFPGSYVTAGSDELQRLRQARPHLEFKALDP